ncbi:hypothetical protein [Brevundimonas sp. SORGH_AS_0993]|uniref:hypothetical protein n=1 Tax=Brevundimonas sp. SORGH_AS_0993 TaxID=3041794 RepID=UPI00277E3B28|nr:hypothetical protein [Brevundimonas sp. SORGH_AS_0993]MDQ1154505.1 hypothetical protein [Brevundimonas sp. SORGH_AS_0993]
MLARRGGFRHWRQMDLIPTLILLTAALAAMVFCGWRGARPPDPFKGPRMIPWRFLMIGAAAVALLLLIHLTTLFGADRAPWVPGG